MAKIVYLFAIVALAQVAYSLDCYSCDPISCTQEQNKWIKISNCGKVSNNQVNTGACLKQIYNDRNTNKEVTIRKCVIAEKTSDGKVSHRCNENEGKVSVCEVCTSDYCNSASSVRFSLVTLLGVAAVYLAPRLL
ncbi:hypothetical protein ABEB36_008838 [Hypothenemus hampei]|uniref:Protein sleepless n=1 Tax=Hypothenemus hampei TaxID=57062 RepID=A0ABD1EN79_HYPHA